MIKNGDLGCSCLCDSDFVIEVRTSQGQTFPVRLASITLQKAPTGRKMFRIPSYLCDFLKASWQCLLNWNEAEDSSKKYFRVTVVSNSESLPLPAYYNKFCSVSPISSLFRFPNLQWARARPDLLTTDPTVWRDNSGKRAWRNCFVIYVTSPTKTCIIAVSSDIPFFPLANWRCCNYPTLTVLCFENFGKCCIIGAFRPSGWRSRYPFFFSPHAPSRSSLRNFLDFFFWWFWHNILLYTPWNMMSCNSQLANLDQGEKSAVMKRAPQKRMMDGFRIMWVSHLRSSTLTYLSKACKLT